MNEQLFRKKSVQKVSSPEQLNEYIRVASPSVWLVFAAIVILLAGVVICYHFILRAAHRDRMALLAESEPSKS